MVRKFTYDGRDFPDPDPNMTPEDVKKSITDFFPELATATIKEQKKDNDTYYVFERRTGTKG